jgi:predicted Zn-dependent protease
MLNNNIPRRDLLPTSRVQELFETTRGYVGNRADEVEVTVTAHGDEFLRFGNNTLSQSQYTRGTKLEVRVVKDEKSSRKSTDRLDEDYIRRIIDEAIIEMQGQPKNPDLLPMLGPQQYQAHPRFYQRTIDMPPEEKAAIIANAIDGAKERSLTASGLLKTTEFYKAIVNSAGLFAYDKETFGDFSVTMDAENGNISGWSSASFGDIADLNSGAVIETAARKAWMNVNQQEIAPGKYDVVLEPTALAGLLQFLAISATTGYLQDFGREQYETNRSYLSGKLGKRIFGDNVTIFDDVHHPLNSGAPFDGEGFPKKTVKLVDRGVLANLATSRTSAHKYNVEATGHELELPNPIGEYPSSLVLESGTATYDDLVLGMDKGLIVTQLWYIREVNPTDKILTGMTRNGTFYVEDGKIKNAVKNLRFNESLFHLFNNIESSTPSERIFTIESDTPLICPAVRAKDFNFTSVSKF